MLWSLCVEEHFYFLWPSFLAVVKSNRARVLIALVVCTLMALARFNVQEKAMHESLPLLSHLRMDSILWGALGAILVEHLPAHTRIRRALLLLLAFAAVILMARSELTALSRSSPLGVAAGLTLLALIATGVLIDLVQAPKSLLVRVLDFPPIAWIGRLSYAMYLIHFQAIDLGRALVFTKPRAPTLINFLLVQGVFVLLSVLCAAVLHILIERPFLRLKGRFASHAKPPSLSPAAQPSQSSAP